MDEWRDILYPLGFIANFIFMIRFMIQWFGSEIKQESYVPPLFWKFTLAASFLMLCHSAIQLQFSVCLAQGLSGVISWRNLNLLKPKEKQVSLYTVLALFFLIISTITSIFLVQGWLLYNHHFIWARTPTYFDSTNLSLGWHILGLLGVALFASRFWIQWYVSERKQTSYTGRTFWWVSLSGALLSCIYFLMIRDLVNLIGPALGMIPYIRNLMLIQKAKKKSLVMPTTSYPR